MLGPIFTHLGSSFMRCSAGEPRLRKTPLHAFWFATRRSLPFRCVRFGPASRLRWKLSWTRPWRKIRNAGSNRLPCLPNNSAKRSGKRRERQLLFLLPRRRQRQNPLRRRALLRELLTARRLGVSPRSAGRRTSRRRDIYLPF